MLLMPVFENVVIETSTHFVQVSGTSSTRKPAFTYVAVRKDLNPDFTRSAESHGSVNAHDMAGALERIQRDFNS